MEQRHFDLRLFCDLHIIRRKQVIDHQPRIHRLLDRLTHPVALFKITDKFAHSKFWLVKTLSVPDAPQRLLIQLDLFSCKSRTWNDRRRDPIADILQCRCLPLRSFLLGGDLLRADSIFDLVALEADIADGVQYLNAVDLPAELLRFHINCR